MPPAIQENKSPTILVKFPVIAAAAEGFERDVPENRDGVPPFVAAAGGIAAAAGALSGCNNPGTETVAPLQTQEAHEIMRSITMVQLADEQIIPTSLTTAMKAALAERLVADGMTAEDAHAASERSTVFGVFLSDGTNSFTEYLVTSVSADGTPTTYYMDHRGEPNEQIGPEHFFALTDDRQLPSADPTLVTFGFTDPDTGEWIRVIGLSFDSEGVQTGELFYPPSAQLPNGQLAYLMEEVADGIPVQDGILTNVLVAGQAVAEVPATLFPPPHPSEAGTAPAPQEADDQFAQITEGWEQDQAQQLRSELDAWSTNGASAEDLQAAYDAIVQMENAGMSPENIVATIHDLQIRYATWDAQRSVFVDRNDNQVWPELTGLDPEITVAEIEGARAVASATINGTALVYYDGGISAGRLESARVGRRPLLDPDGEGRATIEELIAMIRNNKSIHNGTGEVDMFWGVLGHFVLDLNQIEVVYEDAPEDLLAQRVSPWNRNPDQVIQQTEGWMDSTSAIYIVTDQHSGRLIKGAYKFELIQVGVNENGTPVYRVRGHVGYRDTGISRTHLGKALSIHTAQLLLVLANVLDNGGSIPNDMIRQSIQMDRQVGFSIVNNGIQDNYPITTSIYGDLVVLFDH